MIKFYPYKVSSVKQLSSFHLKINWQTINWQKSSGIILVLPINFLVGGWVLQILWVKLLLPPEDHLGGLYTSAVSEIQLVLPTPRLLAPGQFSYYPYTTPSPTDMVAHFLKHRDPVPIQRCLSSQIEQMRRRPDERASPCLWRCRVEIWTCIPLPRKCPVAKSFCPAQTCGALIAGLIRAFKPILT